MIKCIAGLLRPTGGDILIAGNPRGSRKARQITAYVPEAPQLYNMLTVWEHLRFITDAYEIERWEEKAEQLLRLFEIWEQRDEFTNH
ncbi:ATP-binding cassette domain-containing protein [Pelotomaculum isophthalicicum]|uniref:ATP-binding cassette domain-containing protein n=1 Tax=Pelotomaculum isophthalicicum TaxID=342448 RepID=UPI0030B86495